MQPHLVFTLTAALGATGELAGHERRGSLPWPGRSALIGLMGAALGIDRDGDFAALDGLSLAVAVFDEGRALRDYHTAQTVPSAAVKSPNSRPEALRAIGKDANTTITLRDYRAGPFYGVAVWGGDLEPLAAALNRPHYTLYLGRKSCPLATPPGARVVQAEGPEDALARIVLPPWRQGAVARLLVADATAEDTRREAVHDRPLDRARWHFAAREVGLREVAIQPQGGQG